MTTLAEPIRISSAHPSLPGHFPGRPIVPGVVLLDHVAAALERVGMGRLRHIGNVKFRTPLLPEQDATLHATIDAARVRFRIERSGETILSGEASLA
jgi:3-hydroxymyristoyl/3-hydroxydecanoyl-(acyl carrier protein) dehydratase